MTHPATVTGRALTHPHAEAARLRKLGLADELVEVLAGRAAYRRRRLIRDRRAARHARHAR